MKKCRITVMKVIEHTDLMQRYENPMLHACDLREGQVFIANGWESRRACATAPGRVCRRL